MVTGQGPVSRILPPSIPISDAPLTASHRCETRLLYLQTGETSLIFD
jgi:hypothetical protein